MSTAPVTVWRDDVASHPAVQAWLRTVGSPARATRVDILRERTPTAAVYRLVGAGPHGTDVIAKRQPPGQGAAERYVYEHILPHVSLSAPRCYGVQREDDAHWLFLEDVGTERYSDRNPAHLALVAHWIARFHRRAAGLSAASGLEDGSLTRYRRHLYNARNRFIRRLAGAGLAATDRALLTGIAERLNRLNERWPALESMCAGLPPTVVHGDLRPKNVYLREVDGALVCYPIDWETAGWGIPAVDLTRIDVAAYWTIARRWRAGLDPSHVRSLADLGHVLRHVAAIDWESTGIVFHSPLALSRPLASLRVLLQRLDVAMSTLGLEP